MVEYCLLTKGREGGIIFIEMEIEMKITWQIEIFIGGEWSTLDPVFATKKEAKEYGKYALDRIIFIMEFRIIQSSKEVNSIMENGYFEEIV
jgi:hypothetical protein